ncbi:MAG: choice-of-anchor B family protein [Saprospiraceae bacterium]|nr:choice-of-anchor B family protein [Saprospiraceae bacterium]
MMQPATQLLKRLFTAFFLVASWSLFSQNKLELVSHVEYASLANDVWGYTAPDGTEYALVGLRSGVSVVSLADPANPVQIQLIPGDQSTWRDLKTWGHFAYVTTDQAGTDEGLLIIDLSGLPNGVTWENWKPVLPNQTTPLYTCHNLWIDENGYCYLSGCDQNSGGIIILDVFSTPGTPQFVAYNAPVYAHDCFTQNNLLYTAEIYKGTFSIFDVTDKQSPQLLATQQTPFEFCHNVWANADGSVLFTTDERANAPTAAFDISDPGNIKLLDEFRPPATIGTGVIPHNAHVKGNYVVISNYTDGCVVVDATHPDNLVEVESFDTSTDFDNGFHGCWGAYPYFPSGLIAATDIENGLFILRPTYPRVAYLEGKVVNVVSGAPITNVEVSIQSSDANLAKTNFLGEYKTGQVGTGDFQVIFSVAGYFDLVLPANLVSGQTTILNAQMTPLPEFTLNGIVKDETTDLPIAVAKVLLENKDFSYATQTDANGIFELTNIKQGEYQFFVGSWGHKNLADTRNVAADEDFEIRLAKGYEDDFNNDLGWTVSSTADNGFWVRGKPLGIRAANQQFAPDNDSPTDAGNRAYVTGNTGIGILDDQVDKGTTTLTSPTMQLRSNYIQPMLGFDYWWFNVWSNNAPDDSLVVRIHSGNESAVLFTFYSDTALVQEWTAKVFDLAQFIQLTDDMRLSLTASDRTATPNVVEAGLDNFRVWDALSDSIYHLEDELVKVRVYPNPSADLITIDYKIVQDFEKASLVVSNVWGQKVREVKGGITPIGSIEFDLSGLVAAPYFVYFEIDGKVSHATKLMKVVYGK